MAHKLLKKSRKHLKISMRLLKISRSHLGISKRNLKISMRLLKIYRRHLEISRRNLKISRRHRKILGVRKVALNTFLNEDPQIIGASVQSSVARRRGARNFCAPS